MSSSGSKARAIIVVLVIIFGLLCVGYGVSVSAKYRVQKERVHQLERQLGAGRKEVLKIPTLIADLDKTNIEKKEVQESFSECVEEKESMVEELNELKEEVATFGAVKAAVSVQISGLQQTIKEQQDKIEELEEKKGKLTAQISTLKKELEETTEKVDLQIGEIKRGKKELKEQLDYFMEAKRIAEEELAKKEEAIKGLKAKKEELEKELARIKEEGPSVEEQPAPEPSEEAIEGGERAEKWDLDENVRKELNKTFALLRERISSPTMSLSEVSLLLSRAEKAMEKVSK